MIVPEIDKVRNEIKALEENDKTGTSQYESLVIRLKVLEDGS